LTANRLPEPGLDADEVFRALADPRRRSILSLISSTEMPAGTIAEHFDVTRSATSQHLQILKDARLITERREGTKRFYRASDTALTELRVYVEDLWRQRFDQARDMIESDFEDESAASE
jgi:DNA-binding transcriptional ArsR family regulator